MSSTPTAAIIAGEILEGIRITPADRALHRADGRLRSRRRLCRDSRPAPPAQSHREKKPVGRKIGFTNRTIWAEYGVYAPIWGYMYDTTVKPLDAGRRPGSGPAAGNRASSRRLPSASRGRRAPAWTKPLCSAASTGWRMDFEIVQSVFSRLALRRRRYRGPPTPCTAPIASAPAIACADYPQVDWLAALARFRDRIVAQWASRMERGKAPNVLDGPLSALRHVVALLARDSANAPVARRRDRHHRHGDPRISGEGRRNLVDAPVWIAAGRDRDPLQLGLRRERAAAVIIMKKSRRSASRARQAHPRPLDRP